MFVVAWRRRHRIPEREPVLRLYGVARRLLADEQHPLWDALSRLRPLDREVLMLTAWEGLDGTQAAVVLGCSPQAVHTRVHRARARLGAELEHSCPVTATRSAS